VGRAIAVHRPAPVPRPADIVSRVRRALATRGLTLYQVSRECARIFGRSSPYFVPERFYAGLADQDIGPRIQQLAALSRISNYLLSDWLALFSFSLEDIPRLQIAFPRRRTLLLDASVYNENDWVPWFAPRPGGTAHSAIAPLSEVLKPAAPTRVRDLLALNRRQFLYAKVGTEDFLAFPDLAPGSIARIDALGAASIASTLTAQSSNHIFALETPSGLICGRLRRIGPHRVALCETSASGPRLELTLGRDAKILGVVDAEIRPIATKRAAVAGPGRQRRRAPGNLLLGPPAANLGELIRASRIRAGLSFREASAMSRQVATILGDRAYFLSPGTLSDYDRLPVLPRQIQKLLSLSILYGVGFGDFLRAGGLAIESTGQDPMSDDLCRRAGRDSIPPASRNHQDARSSSHAARDYLATFVDEWEEIPLFLRHSLGEITGLPHPSLLDFFSVRPEQGVADPRLANARLVTVNRRLKRPINAPPAAPSEPPMYMLVKRDGDYLCGGYRRDGGTLTVYRPPPRPVAPVETETRVDAEVVGQVTAILRRLP
jgi:hypothetical protein